MVLVVLFKALSQGNDDYVSLLEANDLKVKCLPVLDFDFVNSEQLRQHLQHPQNFSGIAFSSPRAVEAVQRCINAEEWTGLQSRWAANKTFVVGQATRTAAASLGLDGEGHDSGSAKLLAQHILTGVSPSCKPILFPCSNLKTEALPTLLSESGIALKDITAYVTIPHPGLSQEIPLIKHESSLVAVFYSPSGVDYALPVLKENFALHDVRFVALGPTTEAALHKAGIQVASVASEPSPSGLLNAIKSVS